MLVPRRILALTLLGFFAHMAVWPDGYTSGTYAVLVDYAPLRTWGLIISIASLCMFTCRRLWASALLGGVLFAWTVGLFAATVSGETESPASAWYMGGYVALLFWGVGRNDHQV